MKSPMPYFGGKQRIAPLIWDRFGAVDNYVEPFAGSLAVLLARPGTHRWWTKTETVNDADGFVSNFWRAVQADPDAVAHHADWPVNENDLHARHVWLVRRRADFTTRLEADPSYCDARVAGWWVWGLCAWIGSGWCSGTGPWQAIGGELVNTGDAGRGINRQRPHLGSAGQGINRQLPHLGSAGQGINRQLSHLGNAGRGHCEAWSEHIREMMRALSDRLRRVRVCSGDWTRVVGDTVTWRHGTTGVFLDPPYADTATRTANLYAVDSLDVAHAVREWAIANGDNPLLRIALCGYDGEHEMPGHWQRVAWKAAGGYGSQGEGTGRTNAAREVVWLSPACIRSQPDLFSDQQAVA